MPEGDLLGGALLLGVVAYGVLGGADFGGGVWDLCAGGPRKAAQRRAIAHAMGPVWEANHVWLIFVIVLLFAAFPRAYAALSVALFVPFHLVLFGITLRGAAFVFRAYGPQSDEAAAARRTLGAVFGAASAVTPLLLGMCLGAVSAGGLRVAGADGTLARGGAAALLLPLPLMMGALALSLCAYLAAVYLTIETGGALQRDFRRRALLAGTAVVGLSVLALPLVALRAPHLWRGLLGPRALPVVLCGAGAALCSGGALLRGRFRLARAAAIVQVACLLGGWGLAQHPYLIYPDVRLGDALGRPGAGRFILLTLPPGLLVLLPSLYLLFAVFKRKPE